MQDHPFLAELVCERLPWRDALRLGATCRALHSVALSSLARGGGSGSSSSSIGGTCCTGGSSDGGWSRHLTTPVHALPALGQKPGGGGSGGGSSSGGGGYDVAAAMLLRGLHGLTLTVSAAGAAAIAGGGASEGGDGYLGGGRDRLLPPPLGCHGGGHTACGGVDCGGGGSVKSSARMEAAGRGLAAGADVGDEEDEEAVELEMGAAAESDTLCESEAAEAEAAEALLKWLASATAAAAAPAPAHKPALAQSPPQQLRPPPPLLPAVRVLELQLDVGMAAAAALLAACPQLRRLTCRWGARVRGTEWGGRGCGCGLRLEPLGAWGLDQQWARWEAGTGRPGCHRVRAALLQAKQLPVQWAPPAGCPRVPPPPGWSRATRHALYGASRPTRLPAAGWPSRPRPAPCIS